MALSARRNFEDNELLPRPPFALHVPDQRRGRGSGLIGKKSRVRLRLQNESRRCLQIDAALEEIKLMRNGIEDSEFGTGQSAAGLGLPVPFDFDDAIDVENVGLGLMRIKQLQPIIGGVHPRPAMPRLRIGAILHFLGRVAAPAGHFHADGPGRSALPISRYLMSRSSIHVLRIYFPVCAAKDQPADTIRERT